jgi:hypothetical protein
MHKETAHTGDFGAIYTNMNKYIQCIMLSHNIDFRAVFWEQMNNKALFFKTVYIKRESYCTISNGAKV